MSEGALIPFGKYKGQPVDGLAQDRDHMNAVVHHMNNGCSPHEREEDPKKRREKKP
jgi:hypothetical protein